MTLRTVYFAAALVLGACGTRVTIGVIDPTPPTDLPVPLFDAGLSDARPDGAHATPGCDDKQCGDFCLPCAPDGSACGTPAVFHVCSSDKICRPAQPECVTISDLDAARVYVPCAGSACGAACTRCDPTRPECVAPVSEVCAADGTCKPGLATCP